MTRYDTHRSLFGRKLVRPRFYRRGRERAGMLVLDGPAPAPLVRDRRMVQHIARQDLERAVEHQRIDALRGLSAWMGYR
jgi:hypothetical protein